MYVMVRGSNETEVDLGPRALRIAASTATVKVRDPVKSAVFDALTLGIYGCFWYFYVNRELAALGRARGTKELGDSPGTSLLALVPGLLVIVPAVVSFHNSARRAQAAWQLGGEASTISAPLAALVLMLFFPLGIWYVQRELNAAWAATLEDGARQIDAGSASAGDRQREETGALTDA